MSRDLATARTLADDGAHYRSPAEYLREILLVQLAILDHLTAASTTPAAVPTTTPEPPQAPRSTTRRR